MKYSLLCSARVIDRTGRRITLAAVLLVRLIDVYSLILFAAVVLSWVPAWRGNAFARLVESATEPVLVHVRRVIPPMGGMDLSAMLVFFALQFLRKLVLHV